MAESDTDDTWQTQPHYPEVVGLLKRDMALEIQELTEGTECFGHAWIDSEGVCPESGDCELASFCEQAWNMVQVTRGRSAMAPVPDVVPAPVPKPPVKPNPYIEAHKGSIAKPSKARPLGKKKQKRNKFAGTSKGARKGYKDLGRKVDDLIAAFVEELGDPPRLPLIWNASNFAAKFSHLGPIVVSATRNYHSVLHEGVTIIRFHTNSARHAIVDLTPELLAAVAETAGKLGSGRGGHQQMEAPTKVPAKSWSKLRPCTHRVIVRTPAAATELAKIVRQQYSF